MEATSCRGSCREQLPPAISLRLWDSQHPMIKSPSSSTPDYSVTKPRLKPRSSTLSLSRQSSPSLLATHFTRRTTAVNLAPELGIDGVRRRVSRQSVSSRKGNHLALVAARQSEPSSLLRQSGLTVT